MAVVERIARVRLDSGALGGVRELTATAATLNVDAGGSVVVTVAHTASGTNPPGEPGTLTLSVRNDDGATLASATLTVAAGGSVTRTLYLTSTPLAAGGAARVGTLELELRATRTANPAYDVSSTGSPSTVPLGTTATTDRGWVRGITTRTLAATASGVAVTPLAYGDTARVAVTLGAPLYVARSHTLTLGPRSASVTVGAGSTTASVDVGKVSNVYPAARTAYSPTSSTPTATLTGQPAYLVSTSTAPAVEVDPRLYRTPLYQQDDNTFGTPPLSKDDPTHRRLVTSQGFLGSRTANARGVGVNGVTYNVALTPDKPGSPVTNTGLTTTTVGGEAGWSPQLLAWASQLPGGRWVKSFTVTAPSDATGDAYTINAPGTSTAYTLVARDPNLEARTNANHEAGLGGRHFGAGIALVVTAYLSDVFTGTKVAGARLESATCNLVRASSSNADGTGSRFESLDASGVWRPWGPGETLHRHTLTPSAADPDVFERRFSSDSSWGVRDVRSSVALTLEGVVYSATLVTINVGPWHQHDSQAEAQGPPGADSTVPGPQGERGLTGSQGPQGERGERGFEGPTGPRGERGLTGLTGNTGEPGPQGPQGLEGDVGPAGPRGEQGPEGPRGDTGVGEQGPRGVQGDVGPAGPQGVPGERGLAGAPGPRGDTGAQGRPGLDGATGPQGDRGPQGERGADSTTPGPAGPRGERGAPGERGPDGPPGPPGERGPEGPPGATAPYVRGEVS